MTRIRFNVNQAVLVKLTQVGVDELRRQHEELRKRIPTLKEFTPPRVDADGYSRFQLWVLMQYFGHMLTLGAFPLPFEAEIILDTTS